MSILQLKNISKSFGAIKALDDVSLSLNQGEVLGLMEIMVLENQL